MTVELYECDGCGLCCAGNLIVEAFYYDVMREPRIAEVYPIKRKDTSLPILDSCWVLGCSDPCKFLTPEKRCGIYATRPHACVSFMAGSPKCQGLRKQHGLAALPPVQRPATEMNRVYAESVQADIEEQDEWE